jgi:hypothetical protein
MGACETVESGGRALPSVATPGRARVLTTGGPEQLGGNLNLSPAWMPRRDSESPLPGVVGRFLAIAPMLLQDGRSAQAPPHRPKTTGGPSLSIRSLQDRCSETGSWACLLIGPM